MLKQFMIMSNLEQFTVIPQLLRSQLVDCSGLI